MDFAFPPLVVKAFLPLFVAINIFGILPLFVGMTAHLAGRERQRLLVAALSAATVLALVMLFSGEVIFRTLGITVNDLRVGGGLILLIIAITDLAFAGQMQKRRTEGGEATAGQPDMGIVPLGVPLIIGPGAITSILVAEGQYGLPATLTAILFNMALVFVVFTFGPRLLKLLGPDVSRAMAKVASLFLTAISVAMIRTGIVGMLS